MTAIYESLLKDQNDCFKVKETFLGYHYFSGMLKTEMTFLLKKSLLIGTLPSMTQKI